MGRVFVYEKEHKGIQFERWVYTHGCRKWFNVVRDTSSDKIKAVYKMGETSNIIDNEKNLRVKTSKFIDETYKISFKFNGTTYYGYKGDTLASALLANDIHLVGRSFKYHRPRGIMTAGSEEPNAIVQLHNNTSRTEPNVRATEIEIYEGLEASSQNCWPSVNFDIGGINNILSPVLPAGLL